MAEWRRLRTQADRATDDHVWRAAAESRPGYATWPDTRAGDPSWWLRPVGGGHVAPECMTSHPRIHADCDGCTCACHRTVKVLDFGPAYGDKAGPGTSVEAVPADGETCKQWCGYCHPADERELARVRDAMDRAFAEPLDGPPRREPPPEPTGFLLVQPPPRRRWWHRYTRRNP